MGAAGHESTVRWALQLQFTDPDIERQFTAETFRTGLLPNAALFTVLLLLFGMLAIAHTEMILFVVFIDAVLMSAVVFVVFLYNHHDTQRARDLAGRVLLCSYFLSSFVGWLIINSLDGYLNRSIQVHHVTMMTAFSGVLTVIFWRVLTIPTRYRMLCLAQCIVNIFMAPVQYSPQYSMLLQRICLASTPLVGESLGYLIERKLRRVFLRRTASCKEANQPDAVSSVPSTPPDLSVRIHWWTLEFSDPDLEARHSPDGFRASAMSFCAFLCFLLVLQILQALAYWSTLGERAADFAFCSCILGGRVVLHRMDDQQRARHIFGWFVTVTSLVNDAVVLQSLHSESRGASSIISFLPLTATLWYLATISAHYACIPWPHKLGDEYGNSN